MTDQDTIERMGAQAREMGEKIGKLQAERGNSQQWIRAADKRMAELTAERDQLRQEVERLRGVLSDVAEWSPPFIAETAAAMQAHAAVALEGKP